jgi:hypothetical protein
MTPRYWKECDGLGPVVLNLLQRHTFSQFIAWSGPANIILSM